MEPFLKSVAKFIYTNYRAGIHSMVMIFPNKRARIFFNNYLSEVADSPVFVPKYYTISEYMQQLSGYLIADQLTLLFELYEVYTSVTKSTESFDDFLFYCEMLLADFDDIDKYLVNAEMLFSNLAGLKDIDAYTDYLDDVQLQAIKQFWETFNLSKSSDEKLKFGNLWKVLFKIYSDFNKNLDEKGICYEGKAYRKSIENLENYKQFDDALIAFVGFNALNKCERKLFARVQNLGKTLFFWDYDDYYIRKQETHEAGFFLRKLIPKFPPPPGFSFDTELEAQNKKIHVYNIPSVTGQAKSLQQAIRAIPGKWKKDPVQTAIALADESLLLPVLNSLPVEVDEINISMGYPIKETQVYSLIGILLDLLKNKRSSPDRSESFYYNDAIRILQHGLLNKGAEIENEKLVREINRGNHVYVNTEKFKNLGALYQYIFKPGINANNFVKYLIDILKQLPDGYHNEGSNTRIIENEATFRIVTQLTRISDILSETKVVYSYKSIIRLVGKVLQGTTVPFSGEPLSGLQVMGILETRNLDFENLIILSMNEGIFPKSGNVPSLIPYTLRKGFDLPTVEHQDAIFGYYFYRLLHRAQNIILVYSSSVRDMKSGEPSRFIQQLRYEKGFNPEEHTLSYKIFPLSERITEVKRNDETYHILKSKYTGVNAKVLSPSAINIYLNCQLRFFFRYIARIPEPDNILEEVEANVFGSILHKTMENLYNSIGTDIITAEKLKNLLSDIEKIDNTLINAFWDEYLSPDKSKVFPGTGHVDISGKNLLVKEVILKYIQNIIEYDIRIAPFRILQLEKKLDKDFQLSNNLTVHIGGIIDRLDQLNGKTRIIDYKTGKLKSSFSTVEELFTAVASKRNDAVFQLFLYSLLIGNKEGESYQSIIPGLYFVRALKNRDYDYHIRAGERRNIQIIESVGPFMDEFKRFLQQTLDDIFKNEGAYKQTEDVKYCSFCPYNRICGKV